MDKMDTLFRFGRHVILFVTMGAFWVVGMTGMIMVNDALKPVAYLITMAMLSGVLLVLLIVVYMWLEDRVMRPRNK